MVVPGANATLDVDSLKQHCLLQLSSYKIPRTFKVCRRYYAIRCGWWGVFFFFFLFLLCFCFFMKKKLIFCESQVVTVLEKNALGKVNKKMLLKQYLSSKEK